ncbi:hypothetical protein O9G_004661 [Rozella allomycis CSF55]|uniref:Uncharacterized protein n=1 Tax=Rozella allomycis (strain CSF55) TaxID=988480 RepID=A0A075AYW1_ROZAC|nr:hypothetical protein O9G_004661 [Rozella allomycis CSF55]|eukprot:EPZ35457.1 hypothetical protein O9G_004661 [Rozella allomycis CSF55]
MKVDERIPVVSDLLKEKIAELEKLLSPTGNSNDLSLVSTIENAIRFIKDIKANGDHSSQAKTKSLSVALDKKTLPNCLAYPPPKLAYRPLPKPIPSFLIDQTKGSLENAAEQIEFHRAAKRPKLIQERVTTVCKSCHELERLIYLTSQCSQCGDRRWTGRVIHVKKVIVVKHEK